MRERLLGPGLKGATGLATYKATLGLVAGLAGLALGAIGAVSGARVWAALAGVGAVVAGVIAWRAARAHRLDTVVAPDDGAAAATAGSTSTSDLDTSVDRVTPTPIVAMPNGTSRVDVEAHGEAMPLEPAVATATNPLTDPATDLFNERFFRVTLASRVAAARRHLRPVAVALIEVRQGLQEGDPHPTAPTVVADGLRHTLRSADTACRLDDGRFSLILEDTPENGAVWTVERVRRHLVSSNPHQTLWAGVACYPNHSFDADELFGRAEQALDAALHWPQDRIEVATSDI